MGASSMGTCGAHTTSRGRYFAKLNTQPQYRVQNENRSGAVCRFMKRPKNCFAGRIGESR